MPALDYDYDYYEYRNGRRVTNSSANIRTSANRLVTNGRVATMKNSSPRVATNSYNRINQKSKVTAKANVVRKSPVSKTKTIQKTLNNKTIVTQRKNTVNAYAKKKSNIDISLKTSKKIINKPQEMSLKKPIAQEKQKISLASALRKVALVSVFFFFFFLICYRYSLINEQFNGINKLKKELTKIEATNEQLQADIESRTDLTYVESYAKYQLGMQKPTSSQIQYVNVDKQDRITTPVSIDDGEELNWFEKIVNEIRKILD